MPVNPGGTATLALAHAQACARPCGQSLGPSPPGADSTATHCMPLGVQISVTGPLATAGTTQAPSSPCSAENAVHSNTQRSQVTGRRLNAWTVLFTNKSGPNACLYCD